MTLQHVYWIGVIAFFCWCTYQYDLDNALEREWEPNVKPVKTIAILYMALAQTAYFGFFWPISWFFVRYYWLKSREKERQRREDIRAWDQRNK
jgi:uncharacterized protein with PQ loop repeat